jgi:hypothetical protein
MTAIPLSFVLAIFVTAAGFAFVIDQVKVSLFRYFRIV